MSGVSPLATPGCLGQQGPALSAGAMRQLGGPRPHLCANKEAMARMLRNIPLG